jgi:hypothetical protein
MRCTSLAERDGCGGVGRDDELATVQSTATVIGSVREFLAIFTDFISGYLQIYFQCIPNAAVFRHGSYLRIDRSCTHRQEGVRAPARRSTGFKEESQGLGLSDLLT